MPVLLCLLINYRQSLIRGDEGESQTRADGSSVSGFEKRKFDAGMDIIDIDAVKDIDTPARHAEMDDGKQN